jgi:hypothetical protein
MGSGLQTRLAVGLAAAIDVGAVVIAAGWHAAIACWVACAVHLVATASLGLARGVPGSRRFLLFAFGFTVPIVGGAAALLSLANGGADAAQKATDDAVDVAGDEATLPAPDAQLVRQLGEALSLPEALLVAGAEQRRAMLWSLGRRGDAEAIALLRWALTAASTELGLEAALALEDVGTGFQKRVDACRRALEQTPTGANALAVAELITGGFESGILDGASLATFATEARRACGLALHLDGAPAPEVALARARLELAILRPDAAVAVLDRALDTAAPEWQDDLRRLRHEAALRAKDLPWEGSSALLTYRRPLPHWTARPSYEEEYPADERQLA